jgi:hypothetical protein
MTLKHITITSTLAIALFASIVFGQNNSDNMSLMKGRFVSVIFETDQATIDKLVPKKYQCANSKMFDLNVGTWVLADGSMYHDAFLQIPVMIDGKESYYVPIGYVDNGKEKVDYKNSFMANRKSANFQINQYMNKIYFQVIGKDKPIATLDYTMADQEPTPGSPERIGVSSLPESGKPQTVKVSFVVTRSFYLKGSFSLDNLPEFLVPVIPVLRVQIAHYYESEGLEIK